MSERIPIQIYDDPDVTSNNPVADLDKAYNIQYTQKRNEVWTASFDLPVDDVKTGFFSLLDYAEIYDGDKRIGLFRIDEREPKRTDDEEVIRYHCSHVLDTLNDDYVALTSEVTQAGAETALDYILGEQGTARWQKGTFDFSKSFEYEFNKQTCLDALLSIPKPWWEDYLITFDTTSYPWTLNVISPSTDPKGHLRYSKNLKSVTRTEDAKEMITKLYAFGEGSGDEQVTAGPFTSDPGGYGTIVGKFEERFFDNESDLSTAAQKYLDRVDTPEVKYKGSAVDLYRLSGVNDLEIGDYITVYDPVLGIDEQVPVVKRSKQDVMGKPSELQLELANRAREFPDYGGLAFKDKADEHAAGSVGGGALGSGSVSSDKLDNITMDHIEPGETYDRVLKTDITSGHILLSESIGELGDIDGDIDQVPDGATYARVLKTDITSGHVLLSEVDGTLDDVDEGTNYGKVDIDALSSAKPLLSAAVGDIDDLADGANYGKVAITDIQSGSILLAKTVGDLDDVEDGTDYGKVAITDIQSGSILLAKTVGDLDDVEDGTDYGKVAITDIQSGSILLSKSVGDLDDIDDGLNYAKMPESWPHGSDTTMIDGGKIFANSLSIADVYVDADIDMGEGGGYNRITGCEEIGGGSGDGAIGFIGNVSVNNDLYMLTGSKLYLAAGSGMDAQGGDISNPGTVDGVDVSAHAANDNAHHSKYTDSDVDAHLTGGTGISYSSGEISLDNSWSEENDYFVNAGDLGQEITVEDTDGFERTFYMVKDAGTVISYVSH